MQVKTLVKAAAMASALLAAAASAGNTNCVMDPIPAESYETAAPAATPAATTAAVAATDVATTDAVATTATVTATVTSTDVAATGESADGGDDEGDDSEDGDDDDATGETGAQQTTAGTVATSISFVGDDCGGAGKTYDRVTDVAQCLKEPVTTGSAISPFDDDVSMAFRGPMNIYNIAVFDGSSGSAWSRVSYYKNGGEADNMVFLNNHNIDYAGTSSPEGFALADGTGTATESTPFGGSLAAASNPYGSSIYAEDKTGAEVHIMTSKRCGTDVECVGAYDSDGTAFQGWAGTKKLFITKFDMPNGGAPNVPAIWMLNAQVMRSGQYQCNCRGVGPAGGCGELDIAEVLEKDTTQIATHYYFYDGQFNPGNDRFCSRPTDAPTTFVTIIDEAYGVKIVQIGADDFDFDSESISNEAVAAWESS